MSTFYSCDKTFGGETQDCSVPGLRGGRQGFVSAHFQTKLRRETIMKQFYGEKKFSQSQLNQQSKKPLKNLAELETLENYSSPPLKVVKYLCVRAQSSFFKLNMTHPLSITLHGTVFFTFLWLRILIC